MNGNTTPQKEVAEVLSAEKRRPHTRQMIDGITAATWDESDAVIAHLWSKADDPEVVEEIRESLYTGGPIAADLAAKDRQTRYTETTIEKVLTALIGPRPTEQEATDDR